MMKFKKQNLSLVLGVFLILLMYHTPQPLKDFSNQAVGKVVLIALLTYFALGCDMACAIIFAGIIIVLLQSKKEGFREGAGLMQGRLKKLSQKSSSVADSQSEGFKESANECEEGDEDCKEKFDGKEGFVSINKLKEINGKLQNYLGFSITDLDRFMKTSSEKNTISSTKDLN